MSIPSINSLLNAIGKGGPPLPKAHGLDWGVDHRVRHDGSVGKNFPLGVAKPDLPSGGPPGLDRPEQPRPGQSMPPGLDRPGMTPGGPPGLDRPGQTPGNAPGVDRPGQGVIRDVAGLLPRTPPGAMPPPGQPQSPAPFAAQGYASQPAQLPAPAMAGAQAQQAQAPMHAIQAAPPTIPTQPMQQAHLPLQAQAPAAPRADAMQQTAPQLAQPAQAPGGEATQALPPRAEAAPVPRGDAAMGERMAMLQRAAAPPMPLATSATVAANPAAAGQAALAASAAAGTTMATAPAATQAANQAAESRGTSPLIAADRAQVVARSDIAGTYTGEGPYRRGMRRAARALPGGLSTLLTAFGVQGNVAATGRDPAAAERELRAAMMQWLFWLLAIIAYGCIAFALFGLLPTGSLGGATRVPTDSRAWAGGFALAGLVAGVGAWWFARGMVRDDKGQPRAPHEGYDGD